MLKRQFLGVRLFLLGATILGPSPIYGQRRFSCETAHVNLVPSDLNVSRNVYCGVIGALECGGPMTQISAGVELEGTSGSQSRYSDVSGLSDAIYKSLDYGLRVEGPISVYKGWKEGSKEYKVWFFSQGVAQDFLFIDLIHVDQGRYVLERQIYMTKRSLRALLKPIGSSPAEDIFFDRILLKALSSHIESLFLASNLKNQRIWMSEKRVVAPNTSRRVRFDQ